MDPARVGHPLQRCLNVVEDLLSMQEAKPFATPVRATSSCCCSSASVACKPSLHEV